MGMPRGSNLRGIDTNGVMTHKRFEKLIASGNSKTLDNGVVIWELICNCGNVIWLSKPQLRRWMDRYPYILYNCGCYTEIYLQRAIQGALESQNHRLRKSYEEMLTIVEKNEELSICEEWLDPVEGYKNFVVWAYRNGYYMEQPPDTPEDELWRLKLNSLPRQPKTKYKHYSPKTCEFKEPAKVAKTEVIEHHILFCGILYTFDQFCETLQITNEELHIAINNNSLQILVHNFLHPESRVSIDTKPPRDKDGFMRLIRRYPIHIVD